MNEIRAFCDQWIEDHRTEILEKLSGLIQIPSVLGPPEADAPFGRDIARALDFTLALCRELGFETTNLDGRIGFADYGEGEEMLGILCHLDVVAVGEGWSVDPFAGEIVGDKMIARGIQDDKGPVIAAIYGLAAVKRASVAFRRRVRLIFGCDEETQMRCLRHYLDVGERIPELSFSPDAEYPVVNGELHICSAEYQKEYGSSIRIQAGTAVNAVPGRAEAYIPIKPDALKGEWPDGCQGKLEACGEGTLVTMVGKAAHASVPELGKNALQAMLVFLAQQDLPDADRAAVSELVSVFGMTCHGEGVGLDVEDASGRLTLNLGIMKWNEKGYTLDLDIRAPISLEESTIREALIRMLSSFCREIFFRFSRGFYLPDSTELVGSLRKIFIERYGEELPSIQIGGGTYARNLPNAVSFGPLMPGKIDECHMTDESMTIEDFVFNVKMMADAIRALAV